MAKNLRLKNNLNVKSNNLLYNKLDIVLFLKNMLLIDIMNRFLLDENIKSIINFLIHPKVSINQKQDNKVFYKKYSEKDFNQFYDEISYMINKPSKINKEKEFISLSNKELKKLI